VIAVSSTRAMQYVDQRVGLAFHCWKRLPQDGTTGPKHVGDKHLSYIVFSVLLLIYCINQGYSSKYCLDFESKFTRVLFR